MAQSVFLDASVLEEKEANVIKAIQVKQEYIRFEFPNGFETLRLIEECRALNCLDVSEPDNFDFMYDITMQMLTGKPVFIYFMSGTDKAEVARFVVTNRYMNLRSVDFIDEYPVVVNWLVEFIAGELAKKYPHSLENIRSKMSARNEERMMNQKKQEKEKVIQTSF